MTYHECKVYKEKIALLLADFPFKKLPFSLNCTAWKVGLKTYPIGLMVHATNWLWVSVLNWPILVFDQWIVFLFCVEPSLHVTVLPNNINHKDNNETLQLPISNQCQNSCFSTSFFVCFVPSFFNDIRVSACYLFFITIHQTFCSVGHIFNLLLTWIFTFQWAKSYNFLNVKSLWITAVILIPSQKVI
jgi:hypothetical protein